MGTMTTRRVILTLLILISLLMSWIIWSAEPLSLSEEESQPSITQTIPLETSAVNVFGPAQIIYDGAEDARIINSQDFLNAGGQESIRSAEFYNLRHLGEYTIEEITNSIQAQDTFVYTYDEYAPLSVYQGSFDSLSRDAANMFYNFVFMPMDRSNRILFYNSSNGLLLEAETNGLLQDELTSVILGEEIESRSVKLHQIGTNLLYLPINNIDIPYYDYLMERLPNSYYVDRLFVDTSEVNVRYLSNSVRYNDLHSEMRINEETNVLTYTRQQYSTSELSYLNLIEGSYSVLTIFENWKEGIHYDELNPNNQVITFRRYIEGYPTFSNNNEAIINISVQNNQLMNLSFGLNIIQTPIDPIEEDYFVTLPNGDQVVQQIAQTGADMNLVQNIRIGLTWQYNEESSRVVHFVPEWYLNYDGEWLTLEEFLGND